METVVRGAGRWCGRPALAAGPVTVLVRPEQLEVDAADGDGAGRPACAGPGRRSADYYGHDAVLRVRRPRAAAGLPEIIVRTAAARSCRGRADVVVRARGPVLAWPAFC